MESNVSGTGGKDGLQNDRLNNSPNSLTTRSIHLDEKRKRINDNLAVEPTTTPPPKAATPDVEDLGKQADGASPGEEKVGILQRVTIHFVPQVVHPKHLRVIPVELVTRS